MALFSLRVWPRWLLILGLGACQPAVPEQPLVQASLPSVEDTATSPTPQVATADQLAQRFLPVFRGAWLPTAYYQALVTTRSPYQAWEQLRGVALLLIEPSRRRGDSLAVALSYNHHEGSLGQLLLRPGIQPDELSFRLLEEPAPRHSSLGYELAGADTLLRLRHYTQARQVRSTQTFRRVPTLRPHPDSLDYSVAYALNQLLLAGHYTGVDSLGQACRVQLTATGQVRGLTGYQHYRPQYDFTVALDNDLDYLQLDSHTASPKQLAFTLHADTLRLYDLHADTVQHLHRGKVHYTLVRRP